MIYDPARTIRRNMSAEDSTGSAQVLRTEHLGRKVEGQTIVEDASVEAWHGEVLVIVGPSGSGQSSFLRLLNRLDEPTEGTVFLDERDYREMPPRELRRRVGMVLQSPYLFPGTVADNIRFGPAERGELVAAETISRLLERVGLEE
jgi:putative ABC transport system ATP-binding protein